MMKFSNKNLQVMDATAIAFCRDNQASHYWCLITRESETILKAVCGESVGTLIKHKRPMSTGKNTGSRGNS